MLAFWKTQQWSQDWKSSFFIPIPKKAMPPNVQINIQLHSFHMRARLCSKSFKLDLSSTVNQELSDEQTGFLSIRGTGGQIANIHWIMEKSVQFQKNIYFCFIDYAKDFDGVDYGKLWKILQEMGIPNHLTYLLGNLYLGKEAKVRTGHGTTDWFKIGKGVR